MKIAYTIAGLGFGDEGKGACCEYLCETQKADLIVRYSGGAQAAHNVVSEDGRRHVASQIGAGSDGTIPTYIWRNFIIDPIAMLNEADALQKFLNTPDDPLDKVYVHPDCPLVTGKHVGVGIMEENRRNQPHGTCGRGIGSCRHISRTQDNVLRAGADSSLWEDERWKEWARRVHITEHPPEFKRAVFEGSQGILLDESIGFHPHTTWSKVTFDVAHWCYKHLGIERYCNIGCTRTYHTRHGNGPFPSEADLGLEDIGNPTGEYQGKMRFGWFDQVLFNYALDNAGDTVDLLAVSHFDECPLKYCDRYQIGDMVGNNLSRPSCIEDQVLLTEEVKLAKPVLKNLDRFADVADLPWMYRGFGPKFSDRERELNPIDFMHAL